VSSATAFGDHLRMVWLTPSMDGLFMGAASERRRFFDRLVLAIDSEHSARVSALDRSLRSRNRLLEVRNFDDHWCDAIERETAELAVAVAATRGQTLTRLAAMLRARGAQSAFPSADIMLDGWMENALMNEPATAVEDRYREILRHGRARDAAAGRTLDGPHLTDLQVIYAPKNMPARDASTGEQKALLIGLVLAHANLVAEMTGITPLLLLDEVVAHLDPGRRKALFDELAKLGSQHRRIRRDFRRRFRSHHAARQCVATAAPVVFDTAFPSKSGTRIRISDAKNGEPNHAFTSRLNRLSDALKNH
jgi:DNA replication and repair protein RecF